MNLPLQIRASNTDRRFTCHGSLLAESLVPARDDDGGAEGSLIHHLIAARLVQELGATPPEGGLVPPELPPGFVLPAFSAWIVDWAVRWVKETIPADWSLMVESEFAYRYELPRPVWVPVSEITGSIPADHIQRGNEVQITYVIITGHEDVRGLSPDATESISADWKTGSVGADPAESNWQASSYLGLGKMAWQELEKSTFYLAQPKIDEEATGIPRVSHVTLLGAQLDAMNAQLAEQVCLALEDLYTTDSSPKSCRWCPVAKSRPWLCPSLQNELTTMKGTLTKEALAALKAAPNDAQLGDFVISGRTLTEPVKAATELLHERIDAQGYVDAGSGVRITRSTRPGAYEIPDAIAFNSKLKQVLPDEERRVACLTPSMGEIKKQIAAARDIPQKSKKADVLDAETVFDSELRPLTVQGVSRILVLT